MKILGIDTSTGILCLGVADNDKVYEYNLQLGNKISALLVSTVKRIMESLGWGINEIDYFASGIGPGSFTGLRVGLAAIKAMSWSLNKPLVGISSLDVLAMNAEGDYDFIVPVIDAKRDLIYASIYKKQGNLFKRAAPYMLLSRPEFIAKIKKTISAKALNDSVILGNGLNICVKDCLDNLKGIKILDKDYWHLEGRNLIVLVKKAVCDKKISDAFRLQPLYLYPKECQIKFAARKS